MDNKKLQRLVVDALEDVKAHDIEVFNTTLLSDLFDRVVLASGTSNRHTRALASNVAEKVKLGGGTVVSVEGEETGDWVLVDLGDIIVHIMQPAVRAYYSLEEIWGGRPVHLKRGGPPGKPGPIARGRVPAAARRAADLDDGAVTGEADQRRAGAATRATKAAAPRAAKSVARSAPRGTAKSAVKGTAKATAKGTARGARPAAKTARRRPAK
jgi:ribosome-associated protein